MHKLHLLLICFLHICQFNFSGHKTISDIWKLWRPTQGGRRVENIGLAQATCILQKKIRVLCRSELHYSRRSQRAHKQVAFIANPFRFTKDMLRQRPPHRKRFNNALRNHREASHGLGQGFWQLSERDSTSIHASQIELKSVDKFKAWVY